MLSVSTRWAPVLFSVCCVAGAQAINLSVSPSTSIGPLQAARIDFNFFLINSRNPNITEVQSPNSSISTLDLKAPGKARREYERGYRLLMGNDLQGAAEHLSRAIALYPNFVAAHNALGSVYLESGKNQPAAAEFTQAIALDGHLPNSHLNLGCAELALKQYPAAEAAFREASSMAPLDLQLKVALAYGEYMNRDYAAVIATVRAVNAQKHDGAAVIHFFAAAAWEAQGNLAEAQQEMETLLEEDPQSASAGQFRQILNEIKAEEARRTDASSHPAVQVVMSPAKPTAEELARRRQIALQEKDEESQIAEADAAPDPACVDCQAYRAVAYPAGRSSGSELGGAASKLPAGVLRIDVNEISEFFAVTDHGKPVTDLAASDVLIRDDGKPPEAILGFRNESQLPLRLGLVIDTSDSVAGRFSFEQEAATKFMQDAACGKDDLAFVVGVNNLVLLAQDFTADQQLTSRAIHQLVPRGGTALWDAVAYAADKLASRPEDQPVARVLVVISDGDNNSSSMTLAQAIAHAQRDEVAVYTVSTNGGLNEAAEAMIGSRALATLSELTGGAAYVPDTVHQLSRSLADVQQVIRSRYLLTYRPTSLQLDGKYRTIDLTAQKNGRQLKVFARKGYYALAAETSPSDH